MMAGEKRMTNVTFFLYIKKSRFEHTHIHTHTQHKSKGDFGGRKGRRGRLVGLNMSKAQ